MNRMARLLRFMADKLSGNPPGSFYTKDCLSRCVNVEIGVHTYGCPNVIDYGEGSRLTIGRYCSIASGVTIMLGGNHRSDWITTYPFPALLDHWPGAAGIAGHPLTKGNVVIGNDVWLASDALILSGVTIGDGAVVGARAVVTKDVSPYAIVAGNPAKFVRDRFAKEQVQELLAIRWWDWPEEVVAKALPLLCGGEVGQLKAFALEAGRLFIADRQSTDGKANIPQ